MESSPAEAARRRKPLFVFLVLLLLAGLPIAVWLDLRHLSETSLRHQAADINSLISGFRAYYAANVVGRILAAPDHTQVVHNYADVPGAVPIPATLSLELGRVVSEGQQNIAYRFVSDYPFKNRTPHPMDEFEKSALASLRANPNQKIVDVSWSLLTDRVRLIVPILMGPTCVACHNSHPESPKHDWKVGDVRGIQEISITQPLASNLFAFKYLLMYFVLTAAIGFAFITLQNRQAAIIDKINKQLRNANEFLTMISQKISRYLSPQIYRSIFSGEMDVVIRTERKKLTIFFSDIKDFTATTERLQPEEITRLLNEYFTEMSAIALRHGGTIDKFVGDAMLIFFGDPETRGTAEDARACLRMAAEMQGRIAELNAQWRRRGVEEPFRVRMGINTGYCDVGNFGSNDRMDYTIIGAEANLAARLQSIAMPGQIVVSYETYALARDLAEARPMSPITVKGISRQIIPYAVEGLLDASGARIMVFNEHMAGLDLYLDPKAIDSDAAQKVRAVLADALAALDRRSADGGGEPEPG